MSGTAYSLVAGFLLITFAGCGSPIAKLYKKEAARSAPFDEVLASPQEHKGQVFIWGGRIVRTDNKPGHTDLVILEAPLGRFDRPREAESSHGRFIARSGGFLDPAIYRRGMPVTVAGELLGAEAQPLGSTNYRYPVLDVKQLHLWRPEPVHPRDYYYPGYGWYGPYDPYSNFGPYGPAPWDGFLYGDALFPGETRERHREDEEREEHGEHESHRPAAVSPGTAHPAGGGRGPGGARR